MTTLAQRRAARTAANAHVSCPVEVIPGDAAPTNTGTGYYHVTPSGERVRFPNAYRRHFGRPVYVPSSRRVIVGEAWLAEHS